MHDPKLACSVSITWCTECKCIHVGLFDEDQEMIGMGNINDVDMLIGLLQQARSKKEWMLIGERPQRMQ